MTSATDIILESDFSDTKIGLEKGIDWYQCPIDKMVLSKLSEKNDWQPFLHIVGQLGFSTATGVFAFWAFHNLSWPWVVAAVYFHCSFYKFFGHGTGGHELSHKTVFKTQALNEFFIRVVGFLTYFNYIWFRHSHVKHHQFTVHHEFDMEVELPQQYPWYHVIGAFTFSIRDFNRILPRLFRNAFGRRREVILKSFWEQRITPETKPEALKRLVNFSRIIIGGHLALAVIFVATGHWILLFLVTFAPFIAMWFVVLTHLPQHKGMKPDVADWRQSTRTYLAGPIVQFFYWNMNYHVEHHMFPAVPYYNLPKLRKAIEDDLPIATKGLVATWIDMFKTFRRQKQDPDYYAELVYPEKKVTGELPIAV